MKDQFEKEVCSKCKSWEDNQCNETFYYSKYYQCYSEYLEQKLEQAEKKKDKRLCWNCELKAENEKYEKLFLRLIDLVDYIKLKIKWDKYVIDNIQKISERIEKRNLKERGLK